MYSLPLHLAVSFLLRTFFCGKVGGCPKEFRTFHLRNKEVIEISVRLIEFGFGSHGIALSNQSYDCYLGYSVVSG